MRTRLLLALAALVALPLLADSPPSWPGFRGAFANGVEDQAAPVRWSLQSGENVRWRTAIPGLAHSSPAVWGDRVFLTTAISGRSEDELRVGLYGDIAPVDDDSVHRFVVIAVDRATGDILWQTTVRQEVPKIKRHTKATHANSSPATDGERVVAFFGSAGLHALDHDGNIIWQKDLGVLDSGFFQVPDAQWGFGSSPVLHDGVVYVQCDVQGDSFVAAFRAADGSELWRTARTEVPTWGSPTVVDRSGSRQLVVNGWKHIGGYDLATGRPTWWMRGGGDIPVPTPVVAGDLVFLTNAHGGPSPVWAVRLGATGDVTLEEGETSNQAVSWSVDRGGAYMQTPIVVGEHLYVCRDNGVLSCFVARTGERLYQERLGGGSMGFTASAVAAAGHLYYTSETGEVFVLAAGPELREVARNELGEVTLATPAVVDGMLLFRTRGHLVAIAEAPAASTHGEDPPPSPAPIAGR